VVFEDRLRNGGVAIVTIAGSMAPMCCDTTARHASLRRFQIVFLKDTAGMLRLPNGAGSMHALRRRRAQLIRRIFELDPLVCLRWVGRIRIIAFITAPRVVGQIPTHLAAKGADPRSPPQGGAAA